MQNPPGTFVSMDLNLHFWVIQTVAMLLTALLLPGLTVSGPLPAFATVAALAFVNTHVWDAALFFQIPNSFGQHTLMVLGANAVIFWLVVKLLPGIEIRGIFPALAAPVLFTITSVVLSKYEPMVDWSKVYESSKQFVLEIKQTVSEDKRQLTSPAESPSNQDRFPAAHAR